MIIDLAKAVRVEDEIARRGGLGLKRFGRELVGPCPQCDGRDRFAVNISKQVFNCRGCDARGDIIALVQHVDGCDFKAAVQTLAGDEHRQKSTSTSVEVEKRTGKDSEDDQKNVARALRLWDDASEIAGTLAEQYLHRRHLEPPPGDDVLRYYGACPFGTERYSCMIALYRDIVTNEPRAICRTAIGPNGIKIGRMTLGPTSGCAIKIDADENVEYGLTIGEGVETVLAGRQLGFRPAWALGSAGAIRTFPVLAGITSLSILVDHDEADKNGRQAGQEAARQCSQRWTAAGVEVRRVVPRRPGADVADLGARHGR